MVSLYEIARRRVAAYVLRQDDAAIRRRAFDLEDLAMAVAREYHEGEVSRVQPKQPTSILAQADPPPLLPVRLGLDDDPWLAHSAG